MVKFLMLWLVQVVGAMVAALGALLFVLLFGRYIAPVFPAGCSVLTAPAVVVLMVCGCVWLFQQFRLGRAMRAVFTLVVNGMRRVRTVTRYIPPRIYVRTGIYAGGVHITHLTT